MCIDVSYRERIIQDYINAYNHFDIAKMIANLDEAIHFESISNGITNLSLTGLPAFKQQAESAKQLFSDRTQTILSFKHWDYETWIEIAYHGVLATDLPNGLKKGNELNLMGKSIFRFSGNKIIELTDMS